MRVSPSIRERVLMIPIQGRALQDIVYPLYARLYPFLFAMRHFHFEGKKYRYMFHPYGSTLRGERIVEIPIVWEELKAHAGKNILEVGNVLSHYGPCEHEVIDKYEQAPRCLNVDITEFEPPILYDLIVSISTVEHVGWNDHEKNPQKAVQALHHMTTLLAPGGCMLVTFPLAYNPALDDHLHSEDCLFSHLRYMKRTSGRNTWVQTERDACVNVKYGKPYPFANVLVLGYLTRS